MLPSLLGNVTEATYYRWTKCDHGKKNKGGREYKLNVANTSHFARSSVQQPCQPGGSEFTYVSEDLRC